MKNCSLVRSCARVRDLGEVFTPSHIVKSMCKLIPASIWQDPSATFFEPSCGTGNFMAEILTRKLKHCHTTEEQITALQSIYGVDIMQDNIDECRCRLLDIIERKTTLSGKYIEDILDTNIICGNTLTMMDSDGNLIKFKDWKTGQFTTLKQMVSQELALFD